MRNSMEKVGREVYCESDERALASHCYSAIHAGREVSPHTPCVSRPLWGSVHAKELSKEGDHEGLPFPCRLFGR
jgi:hypothetical protein